MRVVRGKALLKLAEGALHQRLGLLGRVDAEEVQCHVVAGQELRLDHQRRPHRDLVDGADFDVRLLEDHAVADHVDAAAPGPAHELRQLARGQVREVHTIELRERGHHHRARGHVDPERERLRREHGLDQAALEELLHHLLVVRQQPRVVLRETAAQQAGVDHAPEQSLFILVGEAGEALRGDQIDRRLLLRCGQVELVVRAPLQRLATPAPREDEVDGRQHIHALQLVEDVQQVVGGELSIVPDVV